MNDDKLDKILEKLDRIIDLLPKENPSYTPTYPPTYPGPDVLQQPFKCSRCGMRLDRVMGYVCSDIYCPTFIKAYCGQHSITSVDTNWQSYNDEDNK